MLPLLMICASLPSMFATGCAAWLALKDRKQWVWFVGLAILAGFAGLLTLNMVQVWLFAARC